MEILEELDARGLEDFHCYLQTADELKDGFKPVKETCLEHADKLYTVDLMVRTYGTKTREVMENILKKINSDKGLSQENHMKKSQIRYSVKILSCFDIS